MVYYLLEPMKDGMSARQWAEGLNRAAESAGRPPAVVACASVAGLSCIRSLGGRGVPTVAIDWRPWELGLRSRYARPLVLPSPAQAPHVWLDFLLEAGRVLDTRPVLLPAGDATLRLVSAHREQLTAHYAFCIPSQETVDILADKRLQYPALEKLGAAVPTTIIPETAGEAAAAVRDLGPPCIVKPAISDLWTLTRGEKLRLVRTPGDARIAFTEMNEAGCGVVMQELIPGADDAIVAAHSYTASDGRLLGMAAKRKVRQDPPGFGCGSYYVSVEHARVCAEASRLLKRLDYRGIAGTEFKIDARDRSLKLMEINPRTAACGHVIVAAGVDLPWLLYQDLTGENPQPIQSYRTGLRGVNLSWDVRSMRRSSVRSPWAWAKWAISIARARSFAVLSWRDPAPGLSMLWRAVWPVRFRTSPADAPNQPESVRPGSTLREP